MTNKEIFLLYQFQEAYRRFLFLREELGNTKIKDQIKEILTYRTTVINRQEQLLSKINRLKMGNKKLEDECQEYDFQLKKIEESLYSGEIASPKELQQLQNRNTEYKNIRENKEENLINQLYLLEEEENSFKQIQEEVAKLNKELRKLERKEDQRRSEIWSQLQKTKQEVEVFKKLVPRGLMEFYERAVDSLKGVVVVPVENGVRSSCHMIISQAVLEKVKKGDKNVSLCENCGRGLFYLESP